MRSFQITYITPIRRASSAGWPLGPVANRAVSSFEARARSAARVALRVQSNARPSLCSETERPEQLRPIPPAPPPYVRTTHVRTASVPGLAEGEQVFCG